MKNLLCQGKGILAIWHDVEPISALADFREWHTREHMPERLSVPGFSRGCRYIAVNASSTIFNFYQTEVPETLTSEPYLERLNNPTPWTIRMMPHFQRVNRSAGRVLASMGAGEGGAIATLRLSPVDEQALIDWLTSTGLPQILEQAGIAAVHLWQADAAASLVETEESKRRKHQSEIADLTVAIEGNNAEFVEAAGNFLQQQQLFQHTCSESDQVDMGVYQLQYRINS